MRISALGVCSLVALSMLAACSSTVATPPIPSPTITPSLRAALEDDIQTYLTDRSGIEKFSAVSLSVSLPSGSNESLTAGKTFRNGSVKVTPKNLYQIASNTKAFTAILCLKLQSAGKLKLSQTLGQWLPEYPQWSSVQIRQLLNMTSGIATYDGTLAWEKAVVANPKHEFSPAELIAFVADTPRKPGYLYSNTNYILAQLVIEKASSMSYTDALRKYIAGIPLPNMYYYPNLYPQPLLDRTVAGYFEDPNQAGLQSILGDNVRDFSLSWGQAAGGIVATPRTVGQWDRAMYQGNAVTAGERSELESLVSLKTGEPIARTTPQEPSGFGLGVAQAYSKEYGRIWFYEGETLGYRLLHVYVPSTNVIVVIGLNSVPEAKEDHISNLFTTIYQTLQSFDAIPASGSSR